MVWATAYKTLNIISSISLDVFFIYSCNIKHQVSMLSLTPLGCHMDKGRPKTKQSCLRPEACCYMVYCFLYKHGDLVLYVTWIYKENDKVVQTMLPKSNGILNSIGLIYESVSIYILHCDRLHIRCAGVPHGLQPQDYGGAVTSADDLFPEKKEQTLLISSLFYILGVNWISTGCVILPMSMWQPNGVNDNMETWCFMLHEYIKKTIK
jgi:hypothetical protein